MEAGEGSKEHIASPGTVNRAKEHFAFVGMVATAWAAFEIDIDVLALKIASVDIKSGLCFTSQVIGASRKVDALIAVTKLRGVTQFSKELENFAKETTAISERRNRAIHDPLVFFDDKTLRVEVSARKTLKYEGVDVNIIEIKKLHDDIRKHAKKLKDLGVILLSKLPA